MDIFGYEWTWKGGFIGGATALVLVLAFRNRRRLLFFLEFFRGYASSLANNEKIHAIIRARSSEARNDESKALNIISRIQEESLKRKKEFDVYVSKAWEQLKAVKLSDLLGLEEAKKTFQKWEETEKERVLKELEKERERCRSEINLWWENSKKELSLERQELNRELGLLATRKVEAQEFFGKLCDKIVTDYKDGGQSWKQPIVDFFETERLSISREKAGLESERERISKQWLVMDEEKRRVLDETNREIERRRIEGQNQLDMLAEKKETVLREIEQEKVSFANEKERVIRELRQYREDLNQEKETLKLHVSNELREEKESIAQDLKDLERKKLEFQNYQVSETDRINNLFEAKQSEKERLSFLQGERQRLAKDRESHLKEVAEFDRVKNNYRGSRLEDQTALMVLKRELEKSMLNLKSWDKNIKRISVTLEDIDRSLNESMRLIETNQPMREYLSKIRGSNHSIRQMIPDLLGTTSPNNLGFMNSSGPYSTWDPQGHLSSQWHD